jgi:endonuclease-3
LTDNVTSGLSSFAQHVSGFAYPNAKDGPASKKRMTSHTQPTTKTVLESPGASSSHETPPIVSTPPTVVAKLKSKKPIQMALDKAHPAPAHWVKQYDLIKEMRRSVNAPVDTMGCATFMNIDAEPRVGTFTCIPSTILFLTRNN